MAVGRRHAAESVAEMTITDLTEHVAQVIAAAVGVDVPVVRSAGRPAHPNPGDCDDLPRVNVWWSQMVDGSNGLTAGWVRGQAEISYEVVVCYPDDDLDVTIPDTEHEATADEFEALADQVWCAVAGGAPSDCDQWIVGPFRWAVRTGGVVSAVGTVTADHAC